MLLITGVGIGFLMWAFSKGPVDVTFAKEYVKPALIDEEAQTEINIGSVIAEWPDFSGPLILGISEVKISDEGKEILNVPKLGVQLSKLPLLVGRIHPEAIIVTDADIKLLRHKDGSFHFLVTSQDTTALDQSKRETIDVTLKDIGESFFKGGNLPDYPALMPLSELEKVIVRNAHIEILDDVNGKNSRIDGVNFSLDRETDKFDLSISYTELPEEKKPPERSADENTEEKVDEPVVSNLDLELTKEETGISIDGTIGRINAASLVKWGAPVEMLEGQAFYLNGSVKGRLNKDWVPEKMSAEILSDQGILDLEGLLETPLSFSNLSANIMYDKEAGLIKIEDTHLDLNNKTVELSGSRDMASNDKYFVVNMIIPTVSFDDIQALWPDNAKDTLFADWMTTRLSTGIIKDLEVSIPLNIHDLADVPAERIRGKLSFTKLSADYRPPMLPVEEASGTATLENDVLDIQVTSGKISNLKINKGSVNFTKLTHPTDIGDVKIVADLTGPVATALTYIEKEPISLGEKIGLKPSEVKGMADVNVVATFPGLADLPAELVKVKVDATMRDVYLPKIVRSLDLSGGPYKLKVEGPMFEVAGQGQLSGRDIDLSYSEYLVMDKAPYSAKINAKLVSDEKLRDHFGVNLKDFVKGDIPIEIAYLEPKQGTVDIDVKADLTKASVFVEPLDYLKKPGIAGTATATALIRKGDISEIKNLDVAIGKSVSAKGNVKFGKVGNDWDVSKVSFSKVKMDKGDDFSMDLTVSSPNVYDIAINGRSFDARPFTGKKKNDFSKLDPAAKSNEPSGIAVNAVVRVDRMVGSDEDGQYIIAPVVTVKTNKNDDITYLDVKAATPNGKLDISMKPNAQNRMELNIVSSNAGETLRALDIYDNVRGGRLEIRGRQVKGGGLNDIAGGAQIENFTVVKAPVLAKFVNLFSLTGMAELLQNKGIGFEKLKSKFEWKNHNGERVINVKDGRTSGASIGLSFDGTINQTKGITNLEGTVAPMSSVNSMVGKIPLLGKLLGGSSGSLIAATYTMKGPSDDPSVFINPLSVLTPGFLRSILFENDKDFDLDLDDEKIEKNNATDKPRYNR
ncbi:MAG: AsmA-like C-terminal domain-containing protein [Pseudobdellovibrionaceae bacterium]|nr:AsmA-like C-terminal domain-containing protein [Pseudobdellovibrionaceae bacterium]